MRSEPSFRIVLDDAALARSLDAELIGEHWVVATQVPKGALGGSTFVIINRQDGRIEGLIATQ
jgi:hypothetical protein